MDSRFRSSLTLLLLAGALLGASSEGFELRSLQGERVQIDPVAGEGPLVLHFWATWCPTCVEELGVLEDALGDCTDAGVRVVAVNVGEDAETVRRYLQDRELTLPVLLDARGRAWRKLSGLGLPLNVSWSGGERRVDFGPRSAEAWRRTLSELGCSGSGTGAGGQAGDAPPMDARPSAPAQTPTGTDS